LACGDDEMDNVDKSLKKCSNFVYDVLRKDTSPVVCLIAEGSYPHVTGGVSSWIQMLVNSMPEYRFIIYAIGAEEKNRGKYAYTLPRNIIEVHEVFLDSFLKDKAAWGKRYKLNDKEKEAVVKVLTGRESSFEGLFDVIAKTDSFSDFILSRSFFDILASAYEKKFSQISFIDYFWTVRSMVLPLFSLLKQDIPKADIYHSVSAGYVGVIGAMSKHKYKKPFIVTEHGIYTREREEEIIKSTWVKNHFKDMWIDFFYNLSNCAYSSADSVITLFSRNRELEIELGCPPEKISIIPNGINLKEYSVSAPTAGDSVLAPGDDAPTPRDGVPTPGNDAPASGQDGRINIGAVVRVVPIKDIKTMIHAFSMVKAEVPGASLYIMGPTDEDPEYFEECRKLLDLLEVKDVKFTGKVNVKEYLPGMDIMVLTSISEGQPLALLEGMAFKKPMVSTDVGSCRELLYGVDDMYGEAGIVVPAMDYVKIANALIKLCKNTNLRNRFGSNGFKRVSELYKLESVIDSYKELYSTIGGKAQWQV
jgi:glycosyltransferase involved in cell wall biosynthesis